MFGSSAVLACARHRARHRVFARYRVFDCAMGEGEAGENAATRLEAVHARIAEAARAAGRDAADIALIAVSKSFDAQAILPVIAAGQTIFGENRVQEAKAKWPELRARHRALKLHLIGPLQSNKAREAVTLFDAIHTIDRDKIARAIAEEQERTDRALELFVQVNTGDEAQKAGVDPRDAVEFVTRCRDEFGLDIQGLMCIPPIDETPSLHFALLRKLGLEAGLTGLSMGMSADFETAVAYGASHVRVGSAIFGERV